MKNKPKASTARFWLVILINKIKSFRKKCLLGHAWSIENLTDQRGRTLRMQRRWLRCKQRQILTIKRNGDGSQKLFWYTS